MTDGPLFPKKSETNEEPESGSHVEIERSDDPSFGKTTSQGRSSLPNMQGKQIGCGTSVFVLLVVVALVVAGGVML
jgi:hypothetical protein